MSPATTSLRPAVAERDLPPQLRAASAATDAMGRAGSGSWPSRASGSGRDVREAATAAAARKREVAAAGAVHKGEAAAAAAAAHKRGATVADHAPATGWAVDSSGSGRSRGSHSLRVVPDSLGHSHSQGSIESSSGLLLAMYSSRRVSKEVQRAVAEGTFRLRLEVRCNAAVGQPPGGSSVGGHGSSSGSSGRACLVVVLQAHPQPGFPSALCRATFVQVGAGAAIVQYSSRYYLLIL